MKQYLRTEKILATLIALIILSAFLLVSACATLPQSSSAATQRRLEAPNSERAAININTASVRELESLPGVGKGIAERIVSHREQYGPFRRAEHLMMVRGISDRKFRELQTMIVVE